MWKNHLHVMRDLSNYTWWILGNLEEGEDYDENLFLHRSKITGFEKCEGTGFVEISAGKHLTLAVRDCGKLFPRLLELMGEREGA